MEMGESSEERINALEARVARLEWLLKFQDGNPNFLIEHRKTPESKAHLDELRRAAR